MLNTAVLNLLDSSNVTLSAQALPATQVQALYVHIPFCFHKCHYCDFYSITRQTPQRMERFVDLILLEAGMWNGPTVTVKPRTVFFGGGTPTLLPAEAMKRLLDGLRDRFDFSGVDEWTVEANPATVTPEYCSILRSAGVNRLSFGAQSFDPAELKLLERHHDPDDVPRSIETARQAGFSRLNLDLIYAIPGQTMESWSKSLEQVVALKTSHLSCYGLTYEPNTPIAVRRRLGLIQQVEETLELQMLRHTRARLTAVGLSPYEISNYAMDGEECRHNLVYWTGGNYIGLGPSAASHVQGWRWKNRPHLREWEQSIADNSLPAIEVEHLSPLRRAGELAMLLLRLTRGLNFSDFADRSGFDARSLWPDVIGRFTRVGLLQATGIDLCLTEQGVVVADALGTEFLNPVE